MFVGLVRVFCPRTNGCRVAARTDRRQMHKGFRTSEAAATVRGMMTESISAANAPSKLVLNSREERGRNYALCISLSAALLLALFWVDPGVQHDPLWIVGGLLISLILIETAPVKRHVELCVEIGPLGIQRTTKVNQRLENHPLLPRACVRDCIITEHVQTFRVTNHLVFRVESTLVPVFPNANLTFSQCQSMLQQIQRVLREH